MVAALGAAGLSLSMIVGTARAVHAPARMPTATIIPLQIELKVDTLSLETAQGVVTGTCRRCHNDERMRGNMSLDAFDVTAAQSNPVVAENMIRKLRAGMMPPAGVRRPSDDSLGTLVSVLENRLDAAAAATPNPGRRTIQRLNRAEYTRSIRDL